MAFSGPKARSFDSSNDLFERDLAGKEFHTDGLPGFIEAGGCDARNRTQDPIDELSATAVGLEAKDAKAPLQHLLHSMSSVVHELHVGERQSQYHQACDAPRDRAADSAGERDRKRHANTHRHHERRHQQNSSGAVGAFVTCSGAGLVHSYYHLS